MGGATLPMKPPYAKADRLGGRLGSVKQVRDEQGRPCLRNHHRYRRRNHMHAPNPQLQKIVRKAPHLGTSGYAGRSPPSNSVERPARTPPLYRPPPLRYPFCGVATNEMGSMKRPRRDANGIASTAAAIVRASPLVSRKTRPDSSSPTPPSASVSAAQHQVARVLNHRIFAKSRCAARLLAFLAERLLADGGCPASQSDLARVLGFSNDFDPATNPLVRIHMSKLRRILESYASDHGRSDPVALAIPRHSYQLVALCNTSATDKVDPTTAKTSRVSVEFRRQVLLVTEFMTVATDPFTDSLSRQLALTLVQVFVDCPMFAAIGPTWRSRLRDERSTVASFALRRGVEFVLDGKLAPGCRGLHASIRIVHALTDAVCWTHWIDAPVDLSRDTPESAAAWLAARIAELVETSGWTVITSLAESQPG